LIAKTGEVTGFNPQSWSINVTFYPLSSDDGNDAGAVEVPLQSSWVGNGWGLYCAPALGTQVTVLFENGNLQLPIGLGFIFSGEVNPIQSVQSGECWLVHSSGSLIKLTNDGNLTVFTQNALNLQGDTVNITATEEINLQAPVVNVSQDIVIANNLSANNGQTTMENGEFNATTLIASNDVSANGISLKTHPHSGVTAGSDNSGPPIP
jgi:phage baseplate assembly protein V